MAPIRTWLPTMMAGALLALCAGFPDLRAQPPPLPPGVRQPDSFHALWEARGRTVAGPDVVIDKFEVVDQDVPTAVARLANEHSVLCGIAALPYPAPAAQAPVQPPFRRINLVATSERVAQILDRLVGLDPTFEWREDNGVINVALRPTFGNAKHPLNAVIPEYAVTDTPYLIVLWGYPEWPVTPLLRLEWAKGVPFGMIYSGPPLAEYPPVSIYAANQTPLQIFNEMARQLKLSWWLFDGRLVGSHTVWFQMNLVLPATPAPPKAAAPGPTVPGQPSSGAAPSASPSGGCCGASGSGSATPQAKPSSAEVGAAAVGVAPTVVTASAPSEPTRPPVTAWVRLRDAIPARCASVAWSPIERSATMMNSRFRAQLWLGRTTAVVNGSRVQLEAAPRLVNGSVEIPLSLLAKMQPSLADPVVSVVPDRRALDAQCQKCHARA